MSRGALPAHARAQAFEAYPHLELSREQVLREILEERGETITEKHKGVLVDVVKYAENCSACEKISEKLADMRKYW